MYLSVELFVFVLNDAGWFLSMHRGVPEVIPFSLKVKGNCIEMSVSIDRLDTFLCLFVIFILPPLKPCIRTFREKEIMLIEGIL